MRLSFVCRLNCQTKPIALASNVARQQLRRPIGQERAEIQPNHRSSNYASNPQTSESREAWATNFRVNDVGGRKGKPLVLRMVFERVNWGTSRSTGTVKSNGTPPQWTTPSPMVVVSQVPQPRQTRLTTSHAESEKALPLKTQCKPITLLMTKNPNQRRARSIQSA